MLLFTLKGLFVRKIFKFLAWLFGHVEKQLDWKDKVDMGNKQLQYTYCVIFPEVKAMRQ